MQRGPLAGFTIGVTADRRSGEQIELLRRKGAAILHAPTIRTHPLGEESHLAQATRAILAAPPEVAILTTALGIRGWFEMAEALDLAEGLLDVLGSREVLARGRKASGAAVTAGIPAPTPSLDDTSAGLVAALEGRDLAGVRVAVQVDGAGSQDLVGSLRERGAEVIVVPVYRWTMPDADAPVERLVTAIVDGRVDAVTFTARPQVENLVAFARAMGTDEAVRAALGSRIAVACVGPVCAAACRDAGFGDPIEPTRPRLGSMVATLAAHFGDLVTEFDLAGVRLRLQGRLVTSPDGEVDLTDREAEVLHALAARPGAVLSKRQLLSKVWGDRESDEHVVEVTVARLRGRLGDAGVGIETVVRRGYRLADR